MNNEIKADYDQQFLLPPSLEDWVSEDHPVRFIREFVDSMDLREMGFRERESEEGRPNYSSELLLKVWIYGYFERIYSTRGLEKACKIQLPLIWLTGIHYPDHNTLWRFFRNNRKVIKKVFAHSVRVALKGDLVGLVLQAVDGTKIVADASWRRSLHLKNLKALLEKLDESLDEVFDKIEESEEKESSDPEYSLPLRLQDKRKLRKFISEGIEELTEGEKRSLKERVEEGLDDLEEGDTEHLNLTDSESRMMKNGRKLDFCYNAQAVIDDKNQVILASSVTSEEVDKHQLTGMLDEARENTGKSSKETVSDSGYFSGEELKQVEDKGYPVLVNIPATVGNNPVGKEKLFDKKNFNYEAKQDLYICPKGGKLTFEKEAQRKNHKTRIYRCRQAKDCAFRGQCSKDRRGRSVERGPYEDYILRQIEKQKDAGKKELLSKRKKIIEPVFGWIKRNHKFSRWTFRGLESVNAQWQLVCTVVNMKKIFAKWAGGKLIYTR